MPRAIRTLFSRPTGQAQYDAGDSKFRRFVNAKCGVELRDYWDLHTWSTANVEAFWEAIWDYGHVIGTFERGKLFDASFPMDKPNPNLIRATLNFSENMLLSHPLARSDKVALTSVIEPDPQYKAGSPEYLNSTFIRSLTFAGLYDEVFQVSEALKSMGVGPGDRVATFAPSNAEAVVLTLATAAIGAIWSSCPSEFGTRATLERLTQIEPKVLLSADFYRYGGKTIAIYPKLLEILESLPTVKNVIVVGQLHRDRQPRESFPQDKAQRTWSSWTDVVKRGKMLVGGRSELPFYQASAMAPLYVLYSSGTTGKPKAIVHSVGGMVLSSKMTNLTHQNYAAGDSLLQFSTLGWMMYNYGLSTLGCGVRLVMYDGSPLKPQSILFELVEKYKISALGVSPRFLQSLDTAGYKPNQHNDLSSLRTLGVAGSVLKAELYDWIRDFIGDVWINNGSGGTDICNLFVGPVPSLPIYHAEIQAPVLGMKLEAWDDNERPVFDEQGNMVITKPFPNMPLGFWGDEDGERYRSAYFDEFKKPVWTQGDWIELSSLTGGVTMYGRSDGVLNPAGVRFGSSELYSVVEEMKHVVEDCIAVGQKILGGDEQVILFVKPKDGGPLSDAVQQELRAAIAKALSPRHVPAKIIRCPKIPYTGNGKRLEVATKKLVNGVPISKINLSSAEDPEALQFFVDHPDLQAPPKAKL